MQYHAKLSYGEKDPLIQLEENKSNIKHLFTNLLKETKGFKYQIAVKNTRKIRKIRKH